MICDEDIYVVLCKKVGVVALENETILILIFGPPHD